MKITRCLYDCLKRVEGQRLSASNLGEGSERPLLGSRCTLYFD